MTKKNILWIVLDLVFLIVFNIVFFVAGGTVHETSVWISYGFIHFAYLMLLVTPFLVKKGSSAAVFGFSLYSISSAYFFVVFIVGLIFIFLHQESYKAGLITHVILAGIYAIMLLSNMIANESTAESIERHEIEVRYVKDCSAKLKGIMEQTADKQLKKQIEILYDIVHASPVKSNNDVRDIELTVINLISALSDNVQNNDFNACKSTIQRIQQNAEERNRRLKYGQ